MAFGASAIHKCLQVIRQGRRQHLPQRRTQLCERIPSFFYADSPKCETCGTMLEAMEKSFSWGDWRLLTSLSLITVVALYVYLMSFFDYWKKKGVPEVRGRPVPIFGNTFKLLIGQKNFMDTFEELYERAGDQPYAGFYQGTQPALLVKDPELLKHILIKDFHIWMDRAFEMDEEIDPLNSKGLFNLKGQRWKDMRNRLSPTFTSGRMKAMLPLMLVCAEDLQQCLKTEVEKNGGQAIVEIKEYLACFSTDVIATCAFGIHCDALQNPEASEFRKMGKLTFKTTWKRSVLLAVWYPNLPLFSGTYITRRLIARATKAAPRKSINSTFPPQLLLISPKLLKFLGLKFTMDESSVFFRNFVKDIMAQREAAIDKGQETGYGDFIHHLVLLKKRGLQLFKDDDEEDELSEFLDTHKQTNGEAKAEPSWINLDLDDLTAQVMIFFSAGFETTSSLMSFALFELSSSESGMKIQRQVQEEVDRVIKEDGGKITYDGLKKMHLLDRVLSGLRINNFLVRPPPPVDDNAVLSFGVINEDQLVAQHTVSSPQPSFARGGAMRTSAVPLSFRRIDSYKGPMKTSQIMELVKFLKDWRMLATFMMVAPATVYLYLMSYFNYWKKKGFPEISRTPVPFFGHTFGLLTGRKNFRETYHELYAAAGTKPFAGFFQGLQPSLLVKDPEIIKSILVMDFHTFTDKAFDVDEEINPLSSRSLANLKGKKWEDMRARLTPAFASGCLKYLFPMMQECSEELLETLRTEIRKNNGQAVLDIKELMACFTTDVIGTCAFGIRCEALKNPEASEFRKMGKTLFQSSRKTNLLMNLITIYPNLFKSLGVKVVANEPLIFLRKSVEDMVKKLDENVKGDGSTMGHDGFIHHLMTIKKLKSKAVTDGTTEEEADIVNNEDRSEDDTSIGSPVTDLSLDDLTAQVMLFFAAGSETTSSLLRFCLYELCANEYGKEIQSKIRDEVDEVIKEEGGKLTFEGLKKMHLLDAALKEVLRLYSPAVFLNRKCLKDYRIPGTNLTLEKDSIVFIPIQALHLDPKYFPDPTQFDPNRFLPEKRDEVNKYAYLPFGEGSRMCIGQRFAEIQTRLGLAALLSAFEFDLCSNRTTVPLKFNKASSHLEMESGMWLKVEERGCEKKS
ncbi:hypothetical protein J437_LFUL009395 [Ladona fulva]|uniref:Cytochrome P450 n=1 Tax=Ladona fulva TaxID=123851 RepID=A0A8K0K6B3_LADFU|nr:hypothetical protein J437_LFUL009395 [Ladona fulva]